MFCSKCGQQNNDGARFCLKCGSPLVQSAEPAKVTSVIEKAAQQTNINSVANDNKPQEVQQKVIASSQKRSKKPKKKAVIPTVLIIGILAIALIGAVIVHRCYDCGKIIFYDKWREDSEISRVAVCKDCFDAYYGNKDNDSQDTDSQDADDVSKDEADSNDDSQSNGAENGESFTFSRSTDCETFTFSSQLNLDEFEETYYDFEKVDGNSEYGNNNEWYLMNSDASVQIRVRAYLSYYSSYEDRLYENPEDIFEVFYDDCLADADGDDDILSVEKCELSNNLQTVVSWHEINDKGVIIGINTDNYFYTIEFWAVDEDILNKLYDDVCNSLTFSAN